MLEPERLNELLSLLKEMTQLKTSNPQLPPIPIRQWLLKRSTTGVLVTYSALILGLVWGDHLGTPPPGILYAWIAVQWLFIFFLFLVVATVIVSIPYLARHRKQLFPGRWTSLENALHRDSELTQRLWTFDKAILAYGLLHYRHRWLFLEVRLATFVGNWGKLAVTALSIYAAKLFKEDNKLFFDSDPFLFWSLVAIAAIVLIFNFWAFHTFLSRERPRQVIQLLEYAIQYEDKLPTPNPPSYQWGQTRLIRE